MNEEEKQLLLNAISERQMLVTAISGLCVAIVAMAGYIIHIHAKYSKIITALTESHSDELKVQASKYHDLAMEMIQSNLRVANMIEGTNRIIDRVIK